MRNPGVPAPHPTEAAVTELDTRLPLTSQDVTAERRAAMRELVPEALGAAKEPADA